MTDMNLQVSDTGDPPELDAERIAELDDKALIVDLRGAAAFAGGHLPGSISLAAGLEGAPDGDFEAAARVIRELAAVALAGEAGSDRGAEPDGADDRPARPGPDKPLRPTWLLGPDPAAARRLAARLGGSVGLEVAGIFPVTALAAWAASGGRMRTLGRLTPAEFADGRAVGTLPLVDADQLAGLAGRRGEFEAEATIVVAGSRPETATTAASLLLALGHRGRVHVLEPGGGEPEG